MDFWRYVRGFDFVSLCLCETWMEEKGFSRLNCRIPRTHFQEHFWECNFARKEGKRGRAREGFVIEKRRG
ncbi:hypothetical protein ALC60_01014 [Trachymyrmex zeteki]|uniref:Uncharacterized protein n=1 Tax=Mycetomoellerius zeteki TaxID=64791 RepID=A0A151XHP0_9HYME|nr:hypothetical protein ALC60_01014 [Trachymyrmex zeteki]